MKHTIAPWNPWKAEREQTEARQKIAAERNETANFQKAKGTDEQVSTLNDMFTFWALT